MKCKCGSNEFLEFYDGATIEVSYQDDGSREQELQEVGNRVRTTCLNCGDNVVHLTLIKTEIE